MGLLGLIDAAQRIITGILIPICFSLALLYFFWGVAKYIRADASSEKAAEEGRRVMIWGVVALFIATSIWGIVSFIKEELTIPDVSNPNLIN